MYDGSKIVTGLIIFLCLITLPAWYSVASGKATYVPDPKVITEEEECIESTQYMRTKHINLLMNWKESVVRQGNRTYLAGDGKEYNISLTETCMDCHSNKAEFCDRCHSYVGVKPYCWDCHIIPKED
jgi:hypothetical protein